jgi:hypothetical protein
VFWAAPVWFQSIAARSTRAGFLSNFVRHCASVETVSSMASMTKSVPLVRPALAIGGPLFCFVPT